MNDSRIDHARLLRDPAAVDSRLGELQSEHIAPLTRFVLALRERMGEGASIPWFDPWDGGITAEALFLLEAPGSRACGSGFISRNNPDETAKNMFTISLEAGLARQRTLLWNVVPWYIGASGRIRPATMADIRAGVSSLEELLGLLPGLRAVVLVGGKAQQAAAHIQRLNPGLTLFKSPHPSPLFVNNRPENRQKILQVFSEVRAFLDQPGI